MEADASARLRRALLGLLVLAMLGVAAELVLLEHYEEPRQWIPLGGLAAGLVSALAAFVRPRRATLLALRAVMAAFVVIGVLGVYLHFRGNEEFELEMDPGLHGLPLFWESVHGATPALAPSAMVYLGLLGLLVVWRHPGLGRKAR